MASYNLSSTLPPLPAYTERPLPPLIAGFPDKYFSLCLLVVAYWVLSLIFHFIDEFDLFPQYRLHTPAELLKRNHVPRWDVVRDVVIQQVVQTMFGCFLAAFEPSAMYGKDEYNVAAWALKLRMAQRAVPTLLSLFALDSHQLAQRLISTYPTIAAILDGGHYPGLVDMVDGMAVPAFSTWEKTLAFAIYWYFIPACQFAIAFTFLDAWQYFVHRAMHLNKWLYNSFHSRHHRLYVPYAFGALYNHPVEGFVMDTVGAGVAPLLAGMTCRQIMFFYTFSTLKTVDDHCGYAFPWDPLQHLTSNNAAYHDIHHQSWGIKTNFSQPFFTFWDSFLGTKWTGGDVSTRYERAKQAAQRKVDGEGLDKQDAATAPHSSLLPAIPAGKPAAQAAASREQVLSDPSPAGGANILMEETREEAAESGAARRTSLRSNKVSLDLGTPSSPPNGSLKSLRERVGSNFHGRAGAVLGYESSR